MTEFLASNDAFQQEVLKIIFLDAMYKNASQELMNIVEFVKKF